MSLNQMWEFHAIIRGEVAPDDVPGTRTINNADKGGWVLGVEDVDEEAEEREEAEKKLVQQQAAKKERRAQAGKEKEVNAERRAVKGLASTSLDDQKVSKRTEKAVAKKNVAAATEKKKGRKAEAEAQNLGKSFGGLTVREEDEDVVMAD